jgi:hypothetical protein
MKKLTAGATLLLALLFMSWIQEEKKITSIALPNTKSRSLASTVPTKKLKPPTALKSKVNVDERKNLVAKLEQLQKCYVSTACPFPQTDPRSYDLAVSKEIAQHLQEFRNKYKKDVSGLTLARQFILSHDGFVQEEALKMLSEYPISQESLSALTAGLQNTPDAPLMKQAILELKRYIGSSMESQVHSFLSDTLATGAHFTAETVSQDISPFINQKSYNKYKNASDTIPDGATAKRNLNSALREFRRLTSGA